jgi:dUTP pyrophosphatase
MIELEDGETLTFEEHLNEAEADLRLASDCYRKLQKASIPSTAFQSPEAMGLVKHLYDAIRHVIMFHDVRLAKSAIKVHLEEGATLARATDGAVGYDLRALIGLQRTVPAMGGRLIVRTGVHLEMPLGMEGTVRPRSGLDRNHGIVAVFGTVDPDFRGELSVTLENRSTHDYHVLPGEKIAQLVFSPVFLPELENVPLNELSDTVRGNKGFGSTGRL